MLVTGIYQIAFPAKMLSVSPPHVRSTKNTEGNFLCEAFKRSLSSHFVCHSCAVVTPRILQINICVTPNLFPPELYFCLLSAFLVLCLPNFW